MTTNTTSPSVARSRAVRRWGRAALAGALAASACNLDLRNPNAPTEEQALSDIDGVIALAIGMQDQYAGCVEDFILPTALITDEWGTQTRALASYQSLLTGESFSPGFGVVEAPWTCSYLVIRSANTLLEVGNVGLSPAFQRGLAALTKLYRGMAFGQLYINYARAPVNVRVEAPVPVDRSIVLDTAIAQLESARAEIEGIPEDSLAGFRTRVLPTTFDLSNTINAMLARYYLFDERYADAAAAAARVDVNELSALPYTAPDRNPIENLAYQLRYVGALQSFVEEAEPGDERPAYWVQVDAPPLLSNPPDTTILPLNEYSLPTANYPLYLPGEMLLIRSEVLARQGDFDEALALLNAVRTQSSSPLDEPVADLPPLTLADVPTLEDFLEQIGYERRYELYEQGLRWEDTRRLPLNLPPGEVWLDFLPIPQQECDANPADPCA